MNHERPIRIMLVDDHLMVRDGLKVFLSVYEDIEVVAEADDGEQAISLCAEIHPDIILMDTIMPNVDGPTATARILADHPKTRVIALTTFSEQDLVQQAIRAGAISYMLKDVDASKLVEAIRDAHHGRSTIDASAAQSLIDAATQAPPLGSDLTPRERDVLALLIEGRTNKEIAKKLFISQATVRLHVSNVLSKLDASNRTEAVSLALQNNLL